MRHILAVTAILATMLIAAPAMAAQGIPSTSNWKAEGPQAHIERGLSLMVNGEFESAFKVLFGKGHTKDVLEKLKFEIYRLSQKSGNPYGYERLLVQKAGKTLIRLRYVLLFDAQPMMFEFIYYKRKSGWALKNVHYSLDVRKIFAR